MSKQTTITLHSATGTTLSFDPNDKSRATISSKLKEHTHCQNQALQLAVASLESLILTHFLAGIDITSPTYLEGVISAYSALDNLNVENKDVVTILKTRTINATVDESIKYEVNALDWETALEAHESEEEALFELQRNLKVSRTSHNCEVDKCIEEYDVTVIRI